MLGLSTVAEIIASLDAIDALVVELRAEVVEGAVAKLSAIHGEEEELRAIAVLFPSAAENARVNELLDVIHDAHEALYRFLVSGTGLSSKTQGLDAIDAASSVLRARARPTAAPPPYGGTIAPIRTRSLTVGGVRFDFASDTDVVFSELGDPLVAPGTVLAAVYPDRTGLSRRANGFELNPGPGGRQGYDEWCYQHDTYNYVTPGFWDYDATKDARSRLPIALRDRDVVSACVSPRSLPKPRPTLQENVILTCAPLPASPFLRGPYMGPGRGIPLDVGAVDLSKLPSVASVAEAPKASSLFEALRRPQVSFCQEWPYRYLRGKANGPDYSRDHCELTGAASLLACCSIPAADKRRLALAIVQIGIDWANELEAFIAAGALWGTPKRVCPWPGGAGQHSGRKWPILFAAYLLGKTAWINMCEPGKVGPRGEWIGEDAQTWIVGAGDVGTRGYTSAMVGIPEWGSAHVWRPELDNADFWADGYRRCCTANSWWAQLAACALMGLRSAWHHEPLFLYAERYYAEASKYVAAGRMQLYELRWTRFVGTDWALRMWDAYRT